MRLTAAMREPCDPLPKLAVAENEQDMRPALLANRVESERVLAECSARHQAVVEAATGEPVTPAAAKAKKSGLRLPVIPFSTKEK